MIEKDTLISVVNRHSNSVGYPVPDNVNGLARTFAVGETKQITFEELQKLSWIPGGMYLLQHYLVIKDDEVIKEILGDVEPEYYYNESDIRNLLENGSLEQLMDCLDFGTYGVIEILKDLAVDLEIPDMRKRKAIFEKTGFDVDTAIRFKEMEEEPEAVPTKEKVRRAATPTPAAEKTRRASAPAVDKYKVVN